MSTITAFELLVIEILLENLLYTLAKDSQNKEQISLDIYSIIRFTTYDAKKKIPTYLKNIPYYMFHLGHGTTVWRKQNLS